METPHLEHPVLNCAWRLIQLDFSVDVHGDCKCASGAKFTSQRFWIKSVDYPFHIVFKILLPLLIRTIRPSCFHGHWSCKGGTTRSRSSFSGTFSWPGRVRSWNNRYFRVRHWSEPSRSWGRSGSRRPTCRSIRSSRCIRALGRWRIRCRDRSQYHLPRWNRSVNI